jgi:DNA-binding transcriptional ArsR family regulator
MADELSVTFAALADPTRRSILARLTLGEATVNELAAPFAMSLPSVSRHLKVLEKAGLVTKGRAAQWRPCRLEVAPLREADAWMAPYRAFFESRFDRLEKQLETMATEREVLPAKASGPIKATIPKGRKR